MKNYIRNSLKVLLGYCISLLVFVVFIYVFLSLAKDHTSQLLPFYFTSIVSDGICSCIFGYEKIGREGEKAAVRPASLSA